MKRRALAAAVAAFCIVAFARFPVGAGEAEQRTKVTRLRGDVKKAINRGLEFLAASQMKDGGIGTSNRTGSTALALMSFLLQGHVPGHGKYGKTMDRAIGFLISIEDNGYLHDPTSRGMYEHGLALLALSEAWGQSKDPRIRGVLIRAVNVTLNAQNHEGGWRYGPRPTSADVSCSAMQVVALASAREAGIAVPEKTMQRAADYLFSCESRSTGGFTYQTLAGAPLGGPKYERSAAATLALMLCGKHKHPATRGGVGYLRAYPAAHFGNGHFYHYGEYYAVQAMYQSGDKHFNEWYPKIVAGMLPKQGKDGGWVAGGGSGSPLNTGFAILTLGVPYRYLPIYQR